MYKLVDFKVESQGFKCPDIYFTPEYHNVWERNTKDGYKKLFTYEEDGNKVFYPFLLRPCSNIKGSEKYDNYYEAVSIYGYSGPVVSTSSDYQNDSLIKGFRSAVKECFEENNIVAELIRFHPLLKNQSFLEGKNSIELLRDKSTIYMDLNDQDKILDKMSGNTRNQVRQSLDNDLKIEFLSNPSKNQIKDFYDIYYKNMKAVNASEYYLFNLDFFIDTFSMLGENSELVFVYQEDNLLSASIFLLFEEYAHYHLSGAKREALDLRVNNFLLFKAAKRYSKLGYKFLHLGGGVEDDDGLFNFKKGFAPDNIVDFYIGRKIHDEEMYQEIYNQRRNYQEIEEGFVLPHS